MPEHREWSVVGSDQDRPTRNCQSAQREFVRPVGVHDITCDGVHCLRQGMSFDSVQVPRTLPGPRPEWNYNQLQTGPDEPLDARQTNSPSHYRDPASRSEQSLRQLSDRDASRASEPFSSTTVNVIKNAHQVLRRGRPHQSHVQRHGRQSMFIGSSLALCSA